MDYEALYQQKLTTADEAVKVVKSGDWVDYGWCTGTACALDKALAGRMSELEDINLRGGILMWQPAIFQIPDVEKKITWNSWHMGGVERKACTAGFGFYNALRYSELPRYYRENITHVGRGHVPGGSDGRARLLQLRPERLPCDGRVRRGRRLSSWRSTRTCRAAWAASRKRSTSPR